MHIPLLILFYIWDSFNKRNKLISPHLGNASILTAHFALLITNNHCFISRPVKLSPTAAPSTSNESDTLRAQPSLPQLSGLDLRHEETSSKLPQAFTKSEPRHHSKGRFSDTSSSRGSSPDKNGHYDSVQSADSDGMCPELRRSEFH